MPQTYRIGVIGRTGRGDYGHGIDTVWLDFPQCKIVAVADDDKVGLAKAAARLKVEQTFTDYREMLDTVKPDIVAICPRWIDAHRDMAVAAAQRGIHIFMEKPFCRSLEEADEVVAACEKTHARLVIAHQTRYSPYVKVAQDWIDSGKLGRVLELRGRGKEDSRGGGEDLWVLGTHVFDLMRAFFGQAQWCYATVQQGGRPITKSDVVQGREGIGPLAGDAVHAMFGFPGGVVAYFDSVRGAGGSPSRFGLQICGSAGILEMRTGHLPPMK